MANSESSLFTQGYDHQLRPAACLSPVIISHKHRRPQPRLFSYRVGRYCYGDIVRCIIIEPQQCTSQSYDAVNHTVITHHYQKRDPLTLLTAQSRLPYRQPCRLSPEGIADLLFRFGLPIENAYIDALTYRTFVLLPTRRLKLPKPYILTAMIAYPLRDLIQQRPFGLPLDCFSVKVEEEFNEEDDGWEEWQNYSLSKLREDFIGDKDRENVETDEEEEVGENEGEGTDE